MVAHLTNILAMDSVISECRFSAKKEYNAMSRLNNEETYQITEGLVKDLKLLRLEDII